MLERNEQAGKLVLLVDADRSLEKA